MELREKARQLREQRKFGKQQQKEILEARRIEKKKHMEALKVAKKGRGRFRFFFVFLMHLSLCLLHAVIIIVPFVKIYLNSLLIY